MNDKVISLKSRKPLQVTLEEEERTAEELRKANIEIHLQAIDNLRKLVADGEIEGIILLGRHKKTGLFYYDAAFPMRDGEMGCTPVEAMSWTGLLSQVTHDFMDIASWAPCIAPNGNVLVPEPYGEDD